MPDKKTNVPKAELESLNITEENLNALQRLLPTVFEEGKVNFDKLKAVLGENVANENERFGLQWAGKSNCWQTIQERSRATLKPDRDESVNFDKTENLFIEGDNLEVLKLLQKAYYGKVKMIYIDPPYNTGKEFVYPDNYNESLETYLQYTGQVDENGKSFSTNKDTEGRFHSKWLNMMYPRLYLARNLLKDDGVIFISIDDNEQANLKKMCDEIFGEENFLANIIWHKKYASANDVKGFSEVHDYVIAYRKTELFKRNLLPRTDKQNKLYKYDDGDGMGLWRSDNLSVKSYSAAYDFAIKNPNTGKDYYPPSGRCWLGNEDKIQKWIDENRIFFGQNGKGAPQLKRYLKEVQDGVVPITYWSYEECGHNDEARKEIKRLFPNNPPFDTPKPKRLINRMLTLSTEKESDIIIDFFSGSCTTAHAILDSNKEDGGDRKFIMVQLPEPTDEKSEAHKAGYKTIADIGKERIRRVIKKIEDEQKGEIQFEEKKQDLGFKVFKLDQSNFKVWDGDPKQDIGKNLELFVDHIDPDASQEDILYELLLKAGFPLTTKITSEIIEDKTVFSIADGSMLICLEDELTNELMRAMAKQKPMRVICLDSGFKENDQLLSNAVQIMKSEGVEDFRTV